MKKKIRLFCVIALMASALSSYSQKLQTPVDSTNSGNELVRLKMDIKSLTGELSSAKASLTEYKTSIQNSGTAKEAKQPYESATQSENHALNNLNARIFILSEEIDKKQQRLQKINTDGVL